MITNAENISSQQDYCLKSLTTLNIGGNAEIAFFPKNVEELKLIRDHLKSLNKPITVVGAGSNLLVSSNGVSGGVVFTNNFKSFEIINDTTIKVGSGLKSAALAKLLLENDLSGLEFLIGIPGSLGGAVTMNSSAHGQSIEDVIANVEVYDIQSGDIITLDKSKMQMEYRNSFVQHNKHFIISATFNLKKASHNEIADLMEFHVTYRRKNHPPIHSHTAGSTFRNPAPGLYVGKMLQEMDAKTWNEGDAHISDKHANFIINTGNATSLDVSRLMYKMYNGIKNKCGHDLIAEIRYIGDPTEEEKEIWKNFQVH